MSEEQKIAKVSEINFKVKLDEKKFPVEIDWEATDGGSGVAKAVLLSMWDKKEKSTLRIDLWAKDMMIEEMFQFFHQNLVTMADTLERATNEHRITGDMRDFADYFAEKTGIKAPEAGE